MRVVSLVPSLTETVSELGAEPLLVGATDWCTRGVPAGAGRVGGTKTPDLDAVVGLAPDLVLANAEENRVEDLDALRVSGIEVWVATPTRVDEVPGMITDLGEILGRAAAAREMAVATAAALGRALATRPTRPVRALTLIWRKPWMTLGADTYAGDLLVSCGFDHVLAEADERYPKLEGRAPACDVVLLPDEPYAFKPQDAEAVAALTGGAPQRFVDGRSLTWHGAATAAGLDSFSALARALTSAFDGGVEPPSSQRHH